MERELYRLEFLATVYAGYPNLAEHLDACVPFLQQMNADTAGELWSQLQTCESLQELERVFDDAKQPDIFSILALWAGAMEQHTTLWVYSLTFGVLAKAAREDGILMESPRLRAGFAIAHYDYKREAEIYAERMASLGPLLPPWNPHAETWQDYKSAVEMQLEEYRLKRKRGLKRVEDWADRQKHMTWLAWRLVEKCSWLKLAGRTTDLRDTAIISGAKKAARLIDAQLIG